MKFLFETHTHTAQASPCSLVKAADLVREYKDAGYSGIVITDHVGDWGFSSVIGSWKQKVEALINAFQEAKALGDRVGLKVLFGMEIALNRPYRDYLVYGFNPKYLYKHENIQDLDISELYELTKKENALLFAAHPFRRSKTMPNAKYLDGIEVFNGNPRHQNNNEIALKWANENNMIKIAGSDFHEHGDISSGIFLDKCPEDIIEFVEIIKSGAYQLKT